MKIAVVTAAIGTALPVEQTVFEGVDYHAFIDFQSEHELPGETMWSLHTAGEWSIDHYFRDRRHAKIYKILPQFFLPGYDYYVWIDSTHLVGMDPHTIVDTYLDDSDIALFKHPERDCVYEEGKLIQEIRFDYPELVQSQLDYYESQDYPRNNGLYELPCRVQRNTGQIRDTMLTWWELICKYSSRDQLSLPYAMRMHNVTPSIMPGRANGIMRNSILPQVVNSDHSRVNV